MIAILGTTHSVFPQKHLRQATEDNGADQNGHSDQVPTVVAQRHDAKTVQQSDERHHQEEGAGEVTVYPSTPARIHYARSPHYA
jgi:NAD(P)H-dependent FMN reductase